MGRWGHDGYKYHGILEVLFFFFKRHHRGHPSRSCPNADPYGRSSLVCNMLSYVEFYRPKFFLLESVVLGLLNHKLQVNKAGPQEGNVVAHGTVKYILRTLISLGYVPFFLPFPALKKVPLLKFSLKRYRDHVRTAIKCASAPCKPGVYGSPQHRRRVIFWGARRGLPPPEFPIPTHNYAGPT